MLVKNRNFMLLNICFTVLMTVMNMLGSTVSGILEPFQFGPEVSGLVGLGFNISGILASFLFGLFLSK
jgi:hypothetical protein